MQLAVFIRTGDPLLRLVAQSHIRTSLPQTPGNWNMETKSTMLLFLSCGQAVSPPITQHCESTMECKKHWNMHSTLMYASQTFGNAR